MAEMTFKTNIMPNSDLGYSLGSPTQRWKVPGTGIEYIRGTWTAASGTWTGVSEDTALYDGKQILLYMPFAGSGNATLELTMADGTKTGAKAVYFESATRFTTHKGQNSILHLIYKKAQVLSNNTTYEGWWYIANRDTTNIESLRTANGRIYAGATKIKPYSLVFLDTDGKFSTLTTAASTAGTDTDKTINTGGKYILPPVIFYYNANNTANANAIVSSTYATYISTANADTRYSHNHKTTFTVNSPLYVECTIDNAGYWSPTETAITQTLIAGKYYIYLGQTYSTEYQVSLTPDHPVYYYDGINLVEYTRNTFLPLTGGTMTGDILGNQTNSLGSTEAPFHQLVLGGATNATMTSASTNPRITFQEGTGTQPIHLVYTDYDSYRNPAGLKLIGATGASPAWLEAEGSIFANGGYRVPHTGNTTGTIGNATTPVYVDAGQIKAGTALKALAYKDNLTAADIPNISWNKIISDKPAYTTRWPAWNEITQSGANSINNGDSPATASTEILTSYASDNGFADTNGVGRVYRRKASNVVNATLVKAALSTDGSTTNQWLNKKGEWSTPTAAQVGAATSGHNHDSTYLKLSGGTMTGTITAKGSVYTDSYTGTLNMNNSNIYGVNSIYTADASENAGEGIHFYRDATHVDSLWMASGNLYFVPNRELGVSTTAANSEKVARLPASITSGRAVYTDETNGKLAISNVTSTELGYLSGVTSAIQSQINSKAASNHNHDSAYLKLTGGTITGTTASTTVSSGALVVSGGVGIGGRATAQEFNATRPMVISAGKVYSNISGSNVLQVAKTTTLYSNGIGLASPGLTAANDAAWIRVTGTSEADMALEIATGDDANTANGERIVVRQYNTTATVQKEAVLLEKQTGATTFPVSVTAPAIYKGTSVVPDTGNTTGSVGNTTTPTYVSDGVIKALSYTIAKSVPSDAVFTDHYAWNDITNKPATATRWPTWAEVTSKPTTFSPAAHDHNRINGLGRLTTVEAIAYNPLASQGPRMAWNIYDNTARTNDAANTPSFDAGVINIPWDWGAYNGQIAIANTVNVPRMQIRSATHTDNGEGTTPRYSPSYGEWREVITAKKATQMGSATKPIYITNTGQVAEGTALSDGAYRAVLNNTVAGALGWDSAGNTNANNLRLVDVNTIAYWNGAYRGNLSNISVVGTIKTGTWQGTKIANDYIANPGVTIAGKDISLGGSLTASDLMTALGISSPMQFMGTLGTNGTATSLSAAAAANKGYTYKVITAGTYQSVAAKVGDVLVSNGSSWILIPSGDEPVGTVTNVATGAGLTGGPITGSGTISLATSGVTAGSYGDSEAQTPAYGATFKVPYITVDTYGRVTSISEHTVKIPTSDNTNTASAVNNILQGSNSGTAITYKPYTSQQANTLSFDTSTTNPTLNTRLNLNGSLYATKLYSGGTEVSVSGHTHSYAASSSAGGAATSANKLNTNAGSVLNPVYFSGGIPVASKGNSIPFVVGTGTTAGTWLGTLDGVTAYYDGLLILYKSPVAGAGTTTLNLNNIGAKTVYINNTTKLTTHFPANQPILLVYSTSQNSSGCWMCLDNYWVNTDYRTQCSCDTAAATAAKVGSMTYYTATANRYVMVNFRYANSSQSALTLNINNQGAKPIYINGAASSSSNYTIPAGPYLVYYNGTNYYLRTDGKITGDITGSATKLATARSLKVALNSITDKTFDGSANVTDIPISGTLGVANGGTGKTGIVANSILYASATNTYAELAPNTTSTRKFLRMTGTGSAGAAPAWDTVTKTDVGLSNVTNDAQVKASLGTAQGDMVYWSAANTPARLGKGGANTILTASGSNQNPTWTSTAATITSATSATADAVAEAILTLGNNQNVSSTNAHSEGKIVLYSANTQSHTIQGANTSTAYTHTLPNDTGTLVSLSGGTAKGAAEKPVYVNATGIVQECSTYAGGTAVTLNGTSKGASTASFYAPTTAGTAGQIMVSTGGAPGWGYGCYYHTWTITNGNTSIEHSHTAYTANSYVVALVVTSGMGNLAGPITWTSAAGKMTLSTAKVSGDVSGYYIIVNGTAI